MVYYNKRIKQVDILHVMLSEAKHLSICLSGYESFCLAEHYTRLVEVRFFPRQRRGQNDM